jgi:Flp pilus assembly protein TadG
MLRRVRTARRSGVASIEAALVLSLVVVPLMIGVWEVGRLVYAQQVVSTAAREGCRLASQGKTVNASGTPTLIMAGSSGSPDPTNPNVWDTVYQAITTGGLPGLARSDVTITFAFIDPPSATNPWEGQKNQRFRVTVSVPFAKVRWVNLGLINPSTVYYQADWQMLVDDPFTLNPALPTW